MNKIIKIVLMFLGVNTFVWLLYFIVINNVPADWISRESLTPPCVVSTFSLVGLVLGIIGHDEL